jgi:Na+/H+-dicarboxylate symporter
MSDRPPNPSRRERRRLPRHMKIFFGLILGLVDMCRTVLNVVGDLVCATFVARSERELRFPSVTAQVVVADA